MVKDRGEARNLNPLKFVTAQPLRSQHVAVCPSIAAEGDAVEDRLCRGGEAERMELSEHGSGPWRPGLAAAGGPSVPDPACALLPSEVLPNSSRHVVLEP